MRIKTLMTSPAVTIEEDAPIHLARALKSRGSTADLFVVKDSRLVGVLRDRDVRRVGPSTIPRLARYELPDLLADIPVREVMERDAAAVTPDTSVEDAARLAGARQAQSLAVLEGDEPVGTVTRTDLLNALIELLDDEAPTSFGHILVPTDFGRAAGRALDAAMDLAVRHRARLTLLHVLPRATRAARMEAVPSAVRAQLGADRRQRCLARLRSLALREGEIGAVTCQVATGDPAAEIVRVAACTEADLIVMGTRGGGWLRRLIGGGLTAAVSRCAPCPVLAVKL
jgi:nucleotide-binding universal stress UspA family protein/CBS domain-containing protein